jgi:two-component system CheB/CheR fusion protein
MRIRPYRTDDNRITGVVIVFVEINATADQLLTVVRDSNDAIIVQSIDGKILAWNPTASKNYGFSEQEALKSDFGIIVASEHRQEFIELLRKVYSGTLVKPFEAQRVTKSGKKLKVIVTMSKINTEIQGYKAIATTEHLIE